MTPVVGTILVLFIVIIAMAGILLWGVPAIQGLQEHAEYQSMMGQMLQVNGEIQALRDPENTRQITVSMNHGSLRVEEGSRWAITMARDTDYLDVKVANWDDDDATTFELNGLDDSVQITADQASGGTFTRRGTNAACSGTCTVSIGTWDFEGNVTRIQTKASGDLKTETWIFEAGRLTYKMRDSSEHNRIHIEMGATFAQQGEGLFLEVTPSFKEPVFDITPADTSFLVRVIELDGDSAAYGKGRHSLYVTLVDNYGLTRGRPSIVDATSLRLQVDDSDHSASGLTGLLEEAFCNHFKAQTSYTSQGAPDATGDTCAGGDANLVYDPPAATFSYELNQGVVDAVLRGP